MGKGQSQTTEEQTSGQSEFANQQFMDQLARQTTGVDPASQRFIDQMRRQAQTGAQAITGAQGLTPQAITSLIPAFTDPHTGAVVDATRAEFDRLREQASRGTSQEATGAGAFGGTRQAVLEATRLGELDRAQAGQIAGLRSQGFNQALQTALGVAGQQAQFPIRQQLAAQQLLSGALGPTGQVSTGLTSGQTRQAGTQAQTGQSTSTTSTPGNLFGDILGLGLTAVGAGLNPFSLIAPAAGAIGGLLGGGGSSLPPGVGQPLGINSPRNLIGRAGG